MKRSLFFIAIVLALVVIAIGIRPGQAAPQHHPSRHPTDETIIMKDFEFSPKEITVVVGSTITFKNEGAKKHTATADDNSWDTGTVAAGESSKPIKFDKGGKFGYFCQFHGEPGGGDMSGTITVEESDEPVDDHGEAATAAPATGESVGTVVFSHKGDTFEANTVTFSITNLPLPDEGKQYEAWLANEKQWLSLGKVNLKADGTAIVEFTDPKNGSLIDQFDKALISEQSNALSPSGPIVYSGQLPPKALVHVRHVMSKFPDTPDNVGLMTGAMEQEAVLTQHVDFLKDAIAKNNLPLAKLHLEHIHNLMTGKDGAKDIDGNGQVVVSPPSDGFGIFNYLVTAVQHAGLAAKQEDATENIKAKAIDITTTAGTASATLTQIQTLTVLGGTVKSINELKPIVDQIAALNKTVQEGTPDASGKVTTAKGSGGLNLAYDSGAGLAEIDLLPGDVTGGKGEPGQANPGTQATEEAPAANNGATQVIMKDFEFSPKLITIKVGSSVVFVNQGAKKHTATADDNSWDTGTLAPGVSSQPIKFDKAGTFAYFCQFHGGPGGTAMSSVIEVK